MPQLNKTAHFHRQKLEINCVNEQNLNLNFKQKNYVAYNERDGNRQYCRAKGTVSYDNNITLAGIHKNIQKTGNYLFVIILHLLVLRFFLSS